MPLFLRPRTHQEKYNFQREKDEFIFPVKELDQPNNEKDVDEKVSFE